jgi:2,4-dienoyl-CoA reductase-like NADH-dependent reductase (Old Yellow Enzyme family)
MSKLFESTSIKGMPLKNRFVRSATWEGMADETGKCTPELIDYMVQLAQGGVGLIITGHAYVRKEGKAGPRQLGVYSDEMLSGLTRMTQAVHDADGKIVLQLAHAGCHAASQLTGLASLGPSARQDDKCPQCREMSLEEVHQTVRSFGDAAARAREAGFDGVQIHAAHGYLLSQFLSAFYNQRTDAYGGSTEKRARMLLEVFDSVRAAVGDAYPILIKMNSEDFTPGGLEVEEMLQVAQMLEKAGIDAIELSGGTQYSGPKRSPVRLGKLEAEDQEVYYREAARRYRERVTVPLILVGGIRSYDVAHDLVETDLADFVAMSRPLIREPNLIKRWRAGDTRRATCLSDNLCFKPTLAGEGLYCVVEKEKGEA